MGGVVSGQGNTGRVHSTERQVSHFAHLFFMFHKLYTVGLYLGADKRVVGKCMKYCMCMCVAWVRPFHKGTELRGADRD